MQNVHVKLKLDNTTAVAYIAHMGGIKSEDCNSLAQQLWSWCIDRSIWVSAAHLPGAQNTVADKKSREFQDETEWMLNKKVFSKLWKYFDTPEIDLFASRLNSQFPRYVSWKPDPDAEAVDALSINWESLKFYAFPPFCMVGRCLRKINADKAEGIVVVPKWPSQSWFPQMLNMLVQEPLRLPKSSTLLTQPHSGLSHPLNNKLELICCRLSGDPLRVQGFHRRLQTSCHPGGIQLGNSTMDTLNDGLTFAVSGNVIHCKQMQS